MSLFDIHLHRNRAVIQIELEVDRAASASRRLCRRDRERAGILITIQVDVVDAHFAGLNTIHYLLKIFVFEI